jgi:hypothetical protein
MKHPLLAGLLLALAFALPARAEPANDKTFEHRFNVRVAVDAAGRVTGTEFVDDTPAAFHALVSDSAARIPFEPALRNGVPVPSRTSLQLRMKFTPEGEAYRAEVLEVTGGGTYVARSQAPKFPNAVLRAGRNVLAVVVVRTRPDGKADAEASSVERIEFYRGDRLVEGVADRQHRELEAALLEAVGGWSFILEEVDGVAVSTELRVPVTLCLESATSKPTKERIHCGEWSKKVAARLPRPAPVDPGIRLAQPNLPAPTAPAA